MLEKVTSFIRTRLVQGVTHQQQKRPLVLEERAKLLLAYLDANNPYHRNLLVARYCLVRGLSSPPARYIKRYKQLFIIQRPVHGHAARDAHSSDGQRAIADYLK